jgi:hypothetical protein
MSNTLLYLRISLLEEPKDGISNIFEVVHMLLYVFLLLLELLWRGHLNFVSILLDHILEAFEEVVAINVKVLGNLANV